jgi:phosphomannomutase
MGRLFGTDGVRGVAGEDLTGQLAMDLAAAAAGLLHDAHAAAARANGARLVAVVGRDPRASGEFLEAAVVAGLAGAGVDVLRLGVIPTPGVAYLTAALGADLGVMLSASHNPAADNGIKLFARGGFKLPDAAEDEIEARLAEPARFRPGPPAQGFGRVRDARGERERYLAHLLASPGAGARPAQPTGGGLTHQAGERFAQRSAEGFAQQAAEGFAQQAAEGFAQQAAEGFAQRSGEGFAQRSGEGFAEQGGGGAAQRSGEGFAQQAAEGFAQRSGEGFAQRSGEGFAEQGGGGAAQRSGEGFAQQAAEGFAQRSGEGFAEQGGGGAAQQADDGPTRRPGNGAARRTGDGSQEAGEGTARQAGTGVARQAGEGTTWGAAPPSAGPLAGLRVVVDCAHGAASELAPLLLRRAGADVIAIGAEPDGENINEGCGSTHLETLCAAVVKYGADAGIAHDGDADRCLAVDAAGQVIDGDQILAVLALGLKAQNRLAGDTVVATVMSNLGFRLAMADAGITVVETAVGDRYVLEAMRAGSYVLGGEQSGHIIMLDHATTGDGLLTALHLLAATASGGVPLAGLARVMTRYPQVLVNVTGVDKARAAKSPELAVAVAAAKAELGASGRVLVRPSGTEPTVRVMVEAKDHADAKRVADSLAATVRSVS